MRVVLEVTAGPSAGTKIVVGRGQTVQVGRTKWADHAIPGDESMADVHFAVLCDARGCRVHDLSGGKGVVVGETEVTESQLADGDRFTAGETTFSVHVEGELPSGAGTAGVAPPESGSAEAETETVVRAKTAADYCDRFDLSEEAQPLLGDEMEPQPFFDLLCEQEHFPDALRFLAFWLPKRAAVTWACQCVRATLGDPLPPEEERPIERAEQWAADPSEENRRAAEAEAEATDPAELAGWVARAAFWSGGSLVAPKLAPVPPDEGLTAQAVTGALLMAVGCGDPTKTADRYSEFLARGKALLT